MINDDDVLSTFIATYLGETMLANARRGHLWIVEDTDEQLVFERFKGSAVGQRYEVAVLSDERYRLGEPVGFTTDERLPQWKIEAETRTAARAAAAARKALDRDARERGKEAFGDLTLSEARQLLMRRKGDNYAGMLAALIRYITHR